MESETKLALLMDVFRPMERVAIGYSGGVDSALLLRIALETLGRENVLAVMAVAPIWPTDEQERAIHMAREMGAEVRTVQAPDISQPAFARHLPNRCYFCKLDIFSHVIRAAKDAGFRWIADGTNLDDLGEDRPGLRALRELGVRSPLAEAGLTKSDVRALAHEFSLPVWDAPARACLATRIPFGTPVTEDRLRLAEAAERAIAGLGFREYRCRLHGDLVRLELPPDELPRALEMRERITSEMHRLGFRHVTVDLDGLRQEHGRSSSTIAKIAQIGKANFEV